MKQVIVIRKDLNMSPGKCVVQGAHASVLAILNTANIKHPSSDVLLVPYLEEIKHWMNYDRYKKICVYVESETELLSIYSKANDLNILCSLVKDSGITEFDDVSKFTAVAIGPAHDDIIDSITGNLKLL